VPLKGSLLQCACDQCKFTEPFFGRIARPMYTYVQGMALDTILVPCMRFCATFPEFQMGPSIQKCANVISFVAQILPL